MSRSLMILSIILGIATGSIFDEDVYVVGELINVVLNYCIN